MCGKSARVKLCHSFLFSLRPNKSRFHTLGSSAFRASAIYEYGEYPILTISRNVLRTFEAEILKLFKNIKPQPKN